MLFGTCNYVTVDCKVVWQIIPCENPAQNLRGKIYQYQVLFIGDEILSLNNALDTSEHVPESGPHSACFETSWNPLHLLPYSMVVILIEEIHVGPTKLPKEKQ